MLPTTAYSNEIGPLLNQIHKICDKHDWEFFSVAAFRNGMKSLCRHKEGRFMAVLPPACILSFLEAQSFCNLLCADTGKTCWHAVDSDPVLRCNPVAPNHESDLSDHSQNRMIHDLS